MDPTDRIDIDGDSTFVLMLECQARGHCVLYGHPEGLQRLGDAIARVQPIELKRELAAHFTVWGHRTRRSFQGGCSLDPQGSAL
jgi:glutathione synthase